MNKRGHIMSINRDEFNTTPRMKEDQRKKIAEEIEAFLASGGVITVLPPGQSTNLDSDEEYRSFSL